LKDLLVDIAERGRSLGVLLIGAQQAASAVAPAIIRNAAVKVVGRLDAGESAEYRFLSAELRERAARFLPGTMVLDQPLIPAPLPMRFPFPAFATSVEEGRRTDDDRKEEQAAVFAKL
jgi:DNA helicase HerA-like ATPase